MPSHTTKIKIRRDMSNTSMQVFNAFTDMRARKGGMYNTWWLHLSRFRLYFYVQTCT